MAEANPVVGRDTCSECGWPVAVKLRKDGRAQWTCSHCGEQKVKGSKKTTDAYLKTITLCEVETPETGQQKEAAKPAQHNNQTAPKRGIFDGL